MTSFRESSNSLEGRNTKDIESFILNVGKLLRDRTSDLSRVKKEKQIAENIIVEFCEKIKESFDVLEKKGLDELNQTVNVKRSEIELHINYLESIREKAGDILRQLKLFEEDDNDSELSNQVKDESNKLVNDCKEKIQEINETQHREFIRYKINTDIEKYVTSLIALGSISNTKMDEPAMKGLLVYQDAAAENNFTKISADQSSHVVFNRNVISPECELTVTELHAVATSDLKPELSPLTQTAESHPFIEVSDKNCASCSSAAVSENIVTSHNVSSSPLSNSEIYANVSFLHDTPPATTNSPKKTRFARVEYADTCSITSSSSICSDIYTNTGYSAASSDIYDNLPCRNGSSTSTNSIQRTSEVPLNTKQIVCARVYQSTAASTNSLRAASDIARSSENPTSCLVSGSNSIISVREVEHGQNMSANPESDVMNEPFKQRLPFDTRDKKNSTQTSLFTKVAKPSISRDDDTCTRYRPVPMMRFNVEEKSDHYNCNIFDICQSLDGKLLIIDNNNHKLKRFDQSYKLQDSLRLPGDPYSVCAAGPGMAAVALRSDKKIQFINLGKKMKLAKSFPVGTNCRGIVYIDGYLNVCTGDISCSFSGRIEVYNNNGQLQYCIPQDPKRLPSVLKYIAATEIGHHRFVTMYSSDSITMLNTTGNLHETFSHKNLNQPEGMCTDGRDQIFVCGFHSNNICQLSSKHQQIKEILSEKDGIKKPIAVHYDGLQSRLLVSCYHSNELCVFTLK